MSWRQDNARPTIDSMFAPCVTPIGGALQLDQLVLFAHAPLYLSVEAPTGYLAKLSKTLNGMTKSLIGMLFSIYPIIQLEEETTFPTKSFSILFTQRASPTTKQHFDGFGSPATLQRNNGYHHEYMEVLFAAKSTQQYTHQNHSVR